MGSRQGPDAPHYAPPPPPKHNCTSPGPSSEVLGIGSHTPWWWIIYEDALRVSLDTSSEGFPFHYVISDPTAFRVGPEGATAPLRGWEQLLGSAQSHRAVVNR